MNSKTIIHCPRLAIVLFKKGDEPLLPFIVAYLDGLCGDLMNRAPIHGTDTLRDEMC